MGIFALYSCISSPEDKSVPDKTNFVFPNVVNGWECKGGFCWKMFPLHTRNKTVLKEIPCVGRISESFTLPNNQNRGLFRYVIFYCYN